MGQQDLLASNEYRPFLCLMLAARLLECCSWITMADASRPTIQCCMLYHTASTSKPQLNIRKLTFTLSAGPARIDRCGWVFRELSATADATVVSMSCCTAASAHMQHHHIILTILHACTHMAVLMEVHLGSCISVMEMNVCMGCVTEHLSIED